jgi:hypothetical protein
MPEILATMQKFRAEHAQDLSQLESALNRLQLYLLPRMKYLDASALMGASSRAASDMQEWHTKITQCRNEAKELKRDEAIALLGKCASGDLFDRLKACRNPTWLPF